MATDYAPLSGSVTIPASASSAPITVTPLSDLLAEGDETVQLALLASSDYSLGLPDADSITLGAPAGGRLALPAVRCPSEHFLAGRC